MSWLSKAGGSRPGSEHSKSQDCLNPQLLPLPVPLSFSRAPASSTPFPPQLGEGHKWPRVPPPGLTDAEDSLPALPTSPGSARSPVWPPHETSHPGMSAPGAGLAAAYTTSGRQGLTCGLNESPSKQASQSASQPQGPLILSHARDDTEPRPVILKCGCTQSPGGFFRNTVPELQAGDFIGLGHTLGRVPLKHLPGGSDVQQGLRTGVDPSQAASELEAPRLLPRPAAAPRPKG